MGEVVYRSRRMQQAVERAGKRRDALALSPRPPKWQPVEGELPQPWRITVALDARGLYDPDLSWALGVPVGAVDRWEEGVEVPTFEQVEKLSQLTEYLPRWFYGRELHYVEGAFMCPGGWVDFDPIVPIDRQRWKIKRDRPDVDKLPLT
jgi:hypothetical protein